MERLDIELNKGIRRSPSFAQNGELEECVNLYPKNGELRNIPVMAALKDGTGESDFVLESGHTLLSLHATDGKNIYISRKETTEGSETYNIYSNVWEEGEAIVTSMVTGFTTDISARVMTIGRIMMILDGSGLHYFIWKSTGYKSLGGRIPVLEMNFGLRGEIMSGALTGEVNGHYNMSAVPDPAPDGTLDGDDSHIRTFTNQAYGLAARLTAEAGRDGYFTHSFFVRYALRLYDGTHANISAPVFMWLSDNELFMESQNWHSSETDIYYSMIRARLDYLLNPGGKSQYGDWADLVKGVDIYVSAPLYSYKADGDKIRAFMFTGGYPAFSPSNIDQMTPGYGFTISRLTNISSAWSGSFQNDSYVKRDMALVHAISFARTAPQSKMAAVTGDSRGWNAMFRLEGRPEGVMDADHMGEGPYYLLRSYDISELNESQSVRTVIDVPTDRITNIVTQTRLEETESFDNVAHVEDAMLYNRRLALSDITEKVECRQSLFSLLPRASAWQAWKCDFGDESTGYPIKDNSDWEGTEGYHLCVEMQDIGGDVIRVDDTDLREDGTDINLRSAVTYLSYLSQDVSKLILYYNTGSTYMGVSLPGLRHNLMLNDTFYYGDGIIDPSLVEQIAVADITPTTDNYRHYPNRIYQSIADNPFVFSLSSTYDVGAGRIIRIASNTEPLSTGQFGQFPVIAFCTDGMWALEVNRTDGTLYDPSPASPDVLTNKESVTSVEGGILYITSQGLKMIGREKQIRLLSGTLEGKNIDEDIFVGPQSAVRPYVSAWASLFTSDVEEVREALQRARIAYDSKNSLAHVFFPEQDKHAVLNMNGLEFTYQVDGDGMPSVILNNYDKDVLQFEGDGHLYTYDGVASLQPAYGWCLSRILEAGGPSVYANIMQMKAYDSLEGGSLLKTALFVSNDRRSWKMLSSLKGASYKYYRFALFTHMNDLEAVSGISMLYNTARTNKLR